METGQLGVAIAILLGAGVLGLAVAKTRQVRQLLAREGGWKTWRLLHALMIFFLVGYLGAAFAVLAGLIHLLELLLGGVFFGGALFVWVVVRATLTTIGRIQAQRVEKEAALIRLREAQAQLVQNGKLVALGHLAAGIAHELNQPLMALGGVTTLLRRRLGAISPEAEEQLNRIGDACERMARIVNNVRSFGRQDPFTLRVTSPREPLENALMLINEQLVSDGIQVERDYCAELPTVLADEHRLQQVFLNLLGNARDALRRANGRQRVIRVSIALEADEVVYVVEDTGPGIAAKHVQQIFDPFFTTKEVGEGMGLGLSLAYGIILEHHGVLCHERARDGGARFVMRLPIRAATESLAGVAADELLVG